MTYGFEVRLKDGKASGAVDKYEEGLYIIDKCREVGAFKSDGPMGWLVGWFLAHNCWVCLVFPCWGVLGLVVFWRLAWKKIDLPAAHVFL